MNTHLIERKDPEVSARILGSAEEVFAKKGLDRATLREITQLANVNVAAVSYYFGSKSQLALAVFDDLSTRINEQRMADLEVCLATSAAEHRAPDLKTILDVFIRPYLDVGKSGRLFARLVMQHRLSPTDLTRAIIQLHFDPMAKRFIAAIADACPHLDPDEFFWRYVFMIGTVVYSVADTGVTERAAQLSGGKINPQNPDDLRNAMLSFLVGGMTAQAANAPPKIKNGRPTHPIQATRKA
jgi:AcrR family transcriptional regulator